MKRVWVSFVIAGVALALFACSDGPQLSPEGRSALRVLLRTNRFTWNVLSDGSTPREVLALRTLIQEPEAVPTLRLVLETGKLPGQLFALCGLYYAAPEVFAREVERYRERKDEVRVEFGSPSQTMPVARVVEKPSAVRLARGESLQRWGEEHLSQPISLDIVGGGFPSLFLRNGVQEEDRRPEAGVSPASSPRKRRHAPRDRSMGIVRASGEGARWLGQVVSDGAGKLKGLLTGN